MLHVLIGTFILVFSVNWRRMKLKLLFRNAFVWCTIFFRRLNNALALKRDLMSQFAQSKELSANRTNAFFSGDGSMNVQKCDKSVTMKTCLSKFLTFGTWNEKKKRNSTNSLLNLTDYSISILIWSFSLHLLKVFFFRSRFNWKTCTHFNL